MHFACGQEIHVEDPIEELNEEDAALEFEMTPADSAVYFFQDAKLSGNLTVFIEEGNKAVFTYRFSPSIYGHCDDCRTITEIYFEADIKNETKFYSNDLGSLQFRCNYSSTWGWLDMSDQIQNTGSVSLKKVSDSVWSAEIIYRNITEEKRDRDFDTIRTNYIIYSPICENEDGTNCYDKFKRRTGFWKITYPNSIKEGIYSGNLFTGTELLHATGNPLDTSKYIEYLNGNVISQYHPDDWGDSRVNWHHIENYNILYFSALQNDKVNINYEGKSCSDYIGVDSMWMPLTKKEINELKEVILNENNWHEIYQDNNESGINSLLSGFAIFTNKDALIGKIDITENGSRYNFHPKNSIANYGQINENRRESVLNLTDKLHKRVVSNLPRNKK